MNTKVAMICHIGPYNLVLWDAKSEIYDLNTDWWAVKAGRISVPEVKRVVMFNIGGQVGQGMDVVAQRVVNNEFDATHWICAVRWIGKHPASELTDHPPGQASLWLSGLVAKFTLGQYPA